MIMNRLMIESLQGQSQSVSAKRKAVDQPMQKPSKVIYAFVEKEHKNLLLKNIFNIKQAMYRAGRQKLPSFPNNLAETHKNLVELNVKTKFKKISLL